MPPFIEDVITRELRQALTFITISTLTTMFVFSENLKYADHVYK